MQRRYGIYTIAAKEAHARECGLPIVYRGTRTAQSAYDALVAATAGWDGVFVPYAAHNDTAV